MSTIARSAKAFVAVAGLVSLATTPISAAAMQADATSDPTLADIICFMSASEAAEVTTGPDSDFLRVVSFFFVGKMVGRDPAFSFAAAAAKYDPLIAQTDFATETDRCIMEFDALIGNLEGAGG